MTSHEKHATDSRFPQAPLVQIGTSWDPDEMEVAVGIDVSRAAFALAKLGETEQLFTTADGHPAIIVKTAEIRYRDWTRKIEEPSLVTAFEQFPLSPLTQIKRDMNIRVPFQNGLRNIHIGSERILESGLYRPPGKNPRSSLVTDFYRSVAAVSGSLRDEQLVLLKDEKAFSTTGRLNRTTGSEVSLRRHRTWLWLDQTILKVRRDGKVVDAFSGHGAGAFEVLDTSVKIGEKVTLRYKDGAIEQSRVPVKCVATNVMDMDITAANLATGGLRLPMELETPALGAEQLL